MAINKTQLAETLSNNVVRLTYTSKNTGETTTFRASLRPSDLLPTQHGIRETADDSIIVVNLDKNAWRSLSVANISNAEIVRN